MTQVMGGCSGQISAGYAEDGTPRKLWNRKCVPAALELLIWVLLFKQTVFLPDFIMS